MQYYIPNNNLVWVNSDYMAGSINTQQNTSYLNGFQKQYDMIA